MDTRIFGFDGWERCTLISRCVAEHERPIGRERKSGWGVTYTARVRITVSAGNRTLIREGSGAGHGIDADKGLAHESALKEAETDATKRALMTFGNPFGLALYDKQQRQVSDAKPMAAATKSSSAEMADAPLEPAPIMALQERIKALAPARLEAFSKGCRAAFKVPDAQPSLGGADHYHQAPALDRELSGSRPRGLTRPTRSAEKAGHLRPGPQRA